MDDNYFARLSKINITQHLERKGDFAFLSWPFAIEQLRLADPTATWEVKRFDGLPFLRAAEVGYFVEVAVTVQGVTLSQIHPVLDAKNRPIVEPTSFDINTSIQRCLVKAIALHGLGIRVFAGEDVSEGETTEQPPPKSKPSAPTAPTGTPATPAQLRYIRRLIDETGYEEQKVLDYFRVGALEELTSQAASRAITSLENQRRKSA